MEAIQLEEQEKKDQRIALIVSVVLHALLLLLFYFLLAWRPQIPPPPEYGIELNFGMDATGGGNISTKAEASEVKNTEESKPAPKQLEPSKEPVQPKVVTAPPVVEQKVVTTPEPSPVAVKEKPEVKPEPKKEEVKEPEKPKAVYPSRSTTASTGSGGSGSSSKPSGSSDGDDADVIGNKGDPKGTVDAKNLYGKPGSGSGGALDMPGWRADIKAPKEETQEFGRIVFEIKVDNSDGELVAIRTLESTVSASVKKLYEDEVRKASYIRTGSPKPGGPEFTTGKVTFIIK